MAKSLKIGITGLPGAGKTQAVLKVIEMFEEEERIVGGMVTEPLVEKGKRTGFTIANWMTKEKGVVARIGMVSDFMVGKYGVDLATLDAIGVKAINDASEKADIIVVDEVGKMEVESIGFILAVKNALESGKPLILTLHKKSRNPLLQEIRRRDDIRILEVTPVNRHLLPFKIVKLLSGEAW